MARFFPQQMVGILMGINCAPLLAFLYSFSLMTLGVYHNSYIMTELAVTTLPCWNALNFFSFLVMLLQDKSHLYRSFIDVTMNSRIVIHLHPDLCPTWHKFSFLFRPDLTFYYQLCECFWNGRGWYWCTWSIVQVVLWSLSGSFTCVSLYVLSWLFYVLCCAFLFSRLVFTSRLRSFDFRYNLGSLD